MLGDGHAQHGTYFKGWRSPVVVMNGCIVGMTTSGEVPESSDMLSAEGGCGGTPRRQEPTTHSILDRPGLFPFLFLFLLLSSPAAPKRVFLVFANFHQSPFSSALSLSPFLSFRAPLAPLNGWCSSLPALLHHVHHRLRSTLGRVFAIPYRSLK